MDQPLVDSISKGLEELEVEDPCPYTDQELDLTQDHIRLLTLLPGARHDPIICTTDIVNLSHKPNYTALSYVWGDATDRLPIQFNGVNNIPITRNLHTVLHHLRHVSDPKTFWIDALCINQAHSDEKPHQIQLMRDIYQNATETCIWLGPESPTSDLAMSLIGALDGSDLSSPQNSPSPEGLQAIADLQRRPWWSRVWVIQEALLSAKPTVRCGTSVLPMEAFMVLDDVRRGWHRAEEKYIHNTVNTITNFSMALRNPFSAILAYWPDARARLLDPTSERSPSTLAEWAGYLTDFDATDPRDKIYGLLGLGTEADRKMMGMALTNKMVTSQVYTLAMMWFLMTARCLLLLSFDVDSRAACPVGETGETLPSWVVDFSENVPEVEEGREWFKPGYVTFLSGKSFKATGDGRLLGQMIPRDYPMFPFNEISALRVKGMVVDRIVYASRNRHMKLDDKPDAVARMRYSIERMEETAERVREWEVEAMKPGWNDPYGGDGGLDGLSRGDVFKRTMVANRDHSGSGLEWDEEWDNLWDIFLGRREIPVDETNGELPGDEARLRYLLPIRLALLPKTSGRSLIITSKGYFGLAPLKSKIGDEVCVLEGASVPFVLRAVDDSELTPLGITPKAPQRFFNLVGEAYVHGVSDGEWIGGRNEDDVIEVLIL